MSVRYRCRSTSTLFGAGAFDYGDKSPLRNFAGAVVAVIVRPILKAHDRFMSSNCCLVEANCCLVDANSANVAVAPNKAGGCGHWGAPSEDLD